MNRFERAEQVLRWLKTEFPIPAETRMELRSRIIYEGEECLGLTGEDSRGLVIFLSERQNRTKAQMIETLIHEAAHAELYYEGLGIMHGDRYWRHFGRMMDAYEHHGKMDSQAFGEEE